MTAVLVACALSLGGCSSADESIGEVESSPSTSPPSTSATATPFPDEPQTLRTLLAAAPEAPQLVVTGLAATVGDETASGITYQSGGLTISGILRVPAGAGPFQSVVLVHGGVNPGSYRSGRELVREQKALIDAGYVVLVTDLRGFADSDDPDSDVPDLDMGSTLDVINAARALATTDAAPVDPSRIGLVGHSLGGALVINAMVVAPDVTSAVVALAPASTDLWVNVNQFLSPSEAVYQAIVDAYGTPKDDPETWADVSALTFADRATAPLLILQGTADDVVDPSWATETADGWAAAGGRVELIPIEGAGHVLEPNGSVAMAAMVGFLDAQM